MIFEHEYFDSSQNVAALASLVGWILASDNSAQELAALARLFLPKIPTLKDTTTNPNVQIVIFGVCSHYKWKIIIAPAVVSAR